LDTIGKVLSYAALPVALGVGFLVEVWLHGSRLRTRFRFSAAACLAFATFLLIQSFSWAIARRDDLEPEGAVRPDGVGALFRSMADLPLPLPAAAALFAALGAVLVFLSLRSRGASVRFPFKSVAEVRARADAQGYAALTPDEKVIFCVWTVDDEVGFSFRHFYVLNSSAVIADTPGALRAIGAGQAASIVERANSLFGPDGPPTDDDARLDLLDGLPESAEEELEELAVVFKDCGDDLLELLASHMTVAADRRLTSAST